MATYAPLSLLTLAFTWLVFVLFGYAAMMWALSAESLRDAFNLSGSSLLTAGPGRQQLTAISSSR